MPHSRDQRADAPSRQDPAQAESDASVASPDGLVSPVGTTNDAQRTLSETEAQFRSITDNIPGLVFQRALNADGTISFPFVNDGAWHTAGLNPEEMRRNPATIAERIHPDDMPQLHADVLRSFADLQAHSNEFRYNHPTLGWRWMHTISKPRRRTDGSLVADAIAFDITDRKNTEQELDDNRQRLNEYVIELQDTKERLEQRTNELIRTINDLVEARDASDTANRAKSDFLATMSHEIRTPMNGVLGMASLLKQTALDPSQQEFIETIEQSGEALLGIINDVLDYSKMEAGQLELDPTTFSVLEIIDNTIQLVRPKCQDNAVTLQSFVDPEVPDLVTGDAGRLRQILLNLLGNAVKFTKNGSIKIECLRPELAGHEMRLSFAVSDTGIGVSEEAQNHLFEVFSQADASTTRQFGGTGLGLSICRRICNLMGGEISVDSAVGKGSTFRFDVKVKLPEDAIDKPAQPRRSADIKTALVAIGAIHPDAGLEAQLHAYGIRTETLKDNDAVFAHSETSGAKNALIVLDADTLSDRPDLQTKLTAIQQNDEQTVWLVGSGSANSGAMGRMIDVPLRQSRLRGQIRNYLTGDAPAAAPVADNDGDNDNDNDNDSVAVPAVPSAAPETDTAQRPPPAEMPETPAAAAQPAPGPEAAVRSAVLNVLLVEDNRVNQRVAQAILEAAGFNSVLAENGLVAVEVLAGEQHFDVVLMDIHMPELDGIAAARKIRELPSPKCDIPIIALTANAMKGDREKYLEAGMNGYVSKPVDPLALTEAIERQLGLEPVKRNPAPAVQRPTAPAPDRQGNATGGNTAPGPATAPKSTAPEATAPGATARTSPLRILLVEDNKVNQRVAMAMLETAGLDVMIAENGRIAVEVVASHDRFDVILMDIHMPEMDGIAATRGIRELPPPLNDTPIIALTANAMKGDREKYLEAGMDDYVSKPIDPKILSEAIERHAGVATGIAPAVQPRAPAVEQPSVTESDVEELFAGMDDILN